MNIEQYRQKQQHIETFSFQKNFKSLNTTLYYFSFLGNIFIILFSYFFIKNVTDTIPKLFEYQDLFFSIFIVLFMTGYELFKRFTFQQLVESFSKTKKVTSGILIGILISIGLVSGSFYLGLNGAHRLIDRTNQISEQTNNRVDYVSDSISNDYKTKINRLESQIEATYVNVGENGLLNKKQTANIKNLESQIKQIEIERDTKLQKIKDNLTEKNKDKLERVKSDSNAFVFITFFLELIILIGVGFNGYYSVSSFYEMKNVLNTPQYKQLETNIRLLQLLYQNGQKKQGDNVTPITKFKSMVSSNRLDISPKEITDFINVCTNLEIINVVNNRNKTYNMSFEDAKTVIEKQINI